MNPTVHVAVAPALWGDPAKLTNDGDVAGAIVTFEPGDPVAVSVLVLTVNPVFVYGPAPGFVTPAIVNDAAAPFANAHDPPLNVTVTA